MPILVVEQLFKDLESNRGLAHLLSFGPACHLCSRHLAYKVVAIAGDLHVSIKVHHLSEVLAGDCRAKGLLRG